MEDSLFFELIKIFLLALPGFLCGNLIPYLAFNAAEILLLLRV